MLLNVFTKNEVCRFSKIWNMDICMKKTYMTSPWHYPPFDFLWNSSTNLRKTYQSGIPSFSLFKHLRAEIFSREVNRKLWWKWILSHCDLDLWPKVTNFKRIRASVLSICLAKTASKSVHPFSWNFVHKQSRTHPHTNTHINYSKKYNPSTISWRCKIRRRPTNLPYFCKMYYGKHIFLFWPYKTVLYQNKTKQEDKKLW